MASAWPKPHPKVLPLMPLPPGPNELPPRLGLEILTNRCNCSVTAYNKTDRRPTPVLTRDPSPWDKEPKEDAVPRPARHRHTRLFPAPQNRRHNVKTEMRMRKVTVGTTTPRILLTETSFPRKGPGVPTPELRFFSKAKVGGESGSANGFRMGRMERSLAFASRGRS